MAAFDWHADPIGRGTPVDPSYRATQNVRRFFRTACGEAFRFDRDFMAWMKSGAPLTMGDAADEWCRRHAGSPARQAAVRSERQANRPKDTRRQNDRRPGGDLDVE